MLRQSLQRHEVGCSSLCKAQTTAAASHDGGRQLAAKHEVLNIHRLQLLYYVALNDVWRQLCQDARQAACCCMLCHHSDPGKDGPTKQGLRMNPKLSEGYKGTRCRSKTQSCETHLLDSVIRIAVLGPGVFQPEYRHVTKDVLLEEIYARCCDVCVHAVPLLKRGTGRPFCMSSVSRCYPA